MDSIEERVSQEPIKHTRLASTCDVTVGGFVPSPFLTCGHRMTSFGSLAGTCETQAGPKSGEIEVHCHRRIICGASLPSLRAISIFSGSDLAPMGTSYFFG
eukprot:4595267-Prymnesium_polylepis.2